MKLKQVIVLSILTVVGLTSCEKNLYDSDSNKPDKKVEDLIISDDFDWKMSRNAECTFQSSTPTLVSIYSDETCTQDQLLATIPVLPNNNITYPLSVLATAKNVYVKYENESGVIVKAASVVDGKIDFTIPAGTQARTARANEDFENIEGTLYFPRFGGGTIMFEDNYPELGDYDFNDFVANYMIEVNPNSSGIIEEIKFTLIVRAIGANKNYIPHFRIKSLSSEDVKEISVEPGEFDGILTVNQLKDIKDKFVLALNGAEDKMGDAFLNTQEDGIKRYPRKLTITMKIDPKANYDLRFINADGFDIFLASQDKTKEIHTLGYGSAFKLEGYGEDNGNPNNYYKDPKTNLIWGICIPERIDHAYENIDFLKAYPDFANWAEGDYNKANNWYLKGNKEYIFPMLSDK